MVFKTLYFLNELYALPVPNEIDRVSKPTQKVKLNLMKVSHMKSTKLDLIQSYFNSITKGKFIIDLKLPLNTSVWENKCILAGY